MNNLFDNCISLEELDLSNFDTGDTEYMSYMFNNCTSLTSLNVKGFNTRKVKEMERMFYACSSLEYLDLSTFDTSNCQKIDSILDETGNLTLKIDKDKCSNVIKILPDNVHVSDE